MKKRFCHNCVKPIMRDYGYNQLLCVNQHFQLNNDTHNFQVSEIPVFPRTYWIHDLIQVLFVILQ